MHDYDLTEEHFQRWKRDNNTHYATEAFRCEHCLKCIPGIADAFRRATNALEFARLAQAPIDRHVSRCLAQMN